MSAKLTNAARERQAAAMRHHDEQMIGARWYAREQSGCPVHGEMHVCVAATNGTLACECGAIKVPMTIDELLKATPSTFLLRAD